MSEELTLREIKKEWHGTFRAYIIGLLASLALTGASFLTVIWKILSGGSLIVALSCLALLQATVQLRYFLHLGEEAKPKWEKFVFYFMLFTLLIIFFGTLWIMFDLHNRVMI